MHNLCPHHCIHRILVSKPVLPATIDHAAIGTFNYVPTRKANRYCNPIRCVERQTHQTTGSWNSPRPGIFCETHPGGVGGSSRLGHHADLIASLVAGLKHGALSASFCSVHQTPWPLHIPVQPHCPQTRPAEGLQTLSLARQKKVFL